jgi:hypothetical protein
MSHLTPYGNIVYERSTGGFHGLSLVEGLEYQVNVKIAVEMATQQLNLYGESGLPVHPGNDRQFWTAQSGLEIGSARRLFNACIVY